MMTCSLFLIQTSVFSQDPEFTQFYSNPVYLNPAFAGSRICPRFVMNHRNEWPNISGKFVTTAAAYDQKVDALRGGLGLVFLNDNAANTLTTTRASLIYSYHLKVTRKFSLNFGVEGSYYQKAVDWDRLTFGDMIDARRGFVYLTNQVRKDEPVNNMDFSAGVVGYTEQFYFGFAAHHLTTPNESFLDNVESTLPMKLTGHIGAILPLGSGGSLYSEKEESISPNILYTRQGTSQQLNMGVYVKKGALVGGVWYRNKDAFILTLGLESDMIKVGYSYDVTLSKISIISGGSHEVSLALNFNCKPKKKQFRPISCPSF
jgi:type IX secretion system PorP/SprF family membrane protein